MTVAAYAKSLAVIIKALHLEVNMRHTNRVRVLSALIMPMMIFAGSLPVQAKTTDSSLPSAGAGSFFSMENLVTNKSGSASANAVNSGTARSQGVAGSSYATVKKNADSVNETTTYTENVRTATQTADTVATTVTEDFSKLVIAYVDDYINVREQPNTDAAIVGKFRSGNVGELSEQSGDWIKISSGNVTGYVKAEFCKIGNDAAAIREDVKVLTATVTTDALNIREQASLDCTVQDTVSYGVEFEVLEELDEWVRVNDGNKEGFLFKEYVTLSEEFTHAETVEEEEQRLKEEREKEEARMAALARENGTPTTIQQSSQPQSQESTTAYTDATVYATTSSDMGVAVAQFAQQFVGNPYVWGGSSLTNGADCSGFTMAVYANFGVSLPHGSYWQLDYGTPVDGLANAAPGDLVVYPGHVALYIGGGQIVHASNSRDGIIISNANYDQNIGIRRLFQ